MLRLRGVNIVVQKTKPNYLEELLDVANGRIVGYHVSGSRDEPLIGAHVMLHNDRSEINVAMKNF